MAPSWLQAQNADRCELTMCHSSVDTHVIMSAWQSCDMQAALLQPSHACVYKRLLHLGLPDSPRRSSTASSTDPLVALTSHLNSSWSPVLLRSCPSGRKLWPAPESLVIVQSRSAAKVGSRGGAHLKAVSRTAKWLEIVWGKVPMGTCILTLIKLVKQPQLLLPNQQGIQFLHKQPHQEVRYINHCGAFRSLQAKVTPASSWCKMQAGNESSQARL